MIQNDETELTLLTLDSIGQCPDTSLMGQMLRHNRNGRTYIIHGFCWDGKDDEWGFMHEEYHADGSRGITIVRPIHHIKGYTNDGKPRFTML